MSERRDTHATLPYATVRWAQESAHDSQVVEVLVAGEPTAKLAPTEVSFKRRFDGLGHLTIELIADTADLATWDPTTRNIPQRPRGESS